MMRKGFYLFLSLCFWIQWGMAQTPKWVEKAKRAVFSVVTYDKDDKILNTGNGFFVSEDGIAVSDYALFKGAQRAVIIDTEGRQMPVLNIMGADDMYDVVKFRVDITDKKVNSLTLATAPPAAGSEIYLLPYSTQKDRSCTFGHVKSIDKMVGNYFYYTLQLRLKEKMVSCPLVTAEGTVFGLAQKSSGQDTTTVCYAADVRYAMDQKISALSYTDFALKDIGIKKALPDTEEQALVFLYMASAQLPLDKYAEEDLAAWSDVWVNERGMPEFTASIEGDELVVEQRDLLGRDLIWPQELSYRVVSETGSEEILISFGRNSSSLRRKLKFPPKGNYVILPNVDGKGYGFFKISEDEAVGTWEALRSSEDEVLRGSLLITLYENLRRKTISPEFFREPLLAYLPKEKNALLFAMALGYLGDCQRLFPADSHPLEEVLWKIVMTHPEPSYRLQAFRQYRTVANSEEAIRRLFTLWQERKAPEKCALSENDYMDLSYTLAIHLPERADEIVSEQLARIENPDRRREYEFISPSVSPRKAERDSVFASLLKAENRRVEPWASAALANLNHPLRERESIVYIRPALEAMREIQRTGDIFFPTSWARALLSGHVSKEARDEVAAFFTVHPDYPTMLSNKIKQQADHLR